MWYVEDRVGIVCICQCECPLPLGVAEERTGGRKKFRVLCFYKVGRMRFRKGMRVEMCSSEEGYLGAWFEGVIVGRHICRGSHCFRIRYRHFITEEGQHLLEDFPAAMLRPIPPHNDTLMGDWTVGNAVEAYDKDCWWRGIVIEVISAKLFLVYFPDTRTQKVYHTSSLRPGYEWLRGQWSLPLWERSQGDGEGNSTVVADCGEASLAPSPEAQSQSQGEEMSEDTVSVPTSAFEETTSSEGLRMASDVFDKHRKFRSKPRPLLESGEVSISLNVTQAVEESGRCKIPRAGEALQSADSGFQEANSNEGKRFKFSEETQAVDHIPEGISKTIGNSTEICPQSIILSGSKFDKFHASTAKGCTALVPLSCDQKDNMEVEKERTEHDTKTLKNKYFDLAAESTTHEMELLAYRYVLQALHVHGPLSWEQEDLLTNLRIELHITSNEHALELERLVF